MSTSTYFIIAFLTGAIIVLLIFVVRNPIIKIICEIKDLRKYKHDMNEKLLTYMCKTDYNIEKVKELRERINTGQHPCAEKAPLVENNIKIVDESVRIKGVKLGNNSNLITGGSNKI